MGTIRLQVIDDSISSDWWKKLVGRFVCIGDELEIRCWKEEVLEIQQASRYGTPSEDGLEVSVKGTATDALLTELLTESPADNGEFCKMTKYFSIFIKGKNMHFYSEHYGTELYITGASSDDISFFSKTIAPYEKQLSVCIDQSN